MLSVILMSLKFEVQVDGAGGREAYTALNEWKKSFLLTIQFFFFFFLKIYLLIDWLLCWVFVSVRGLSPVAASGDHSSSRCAGLSLLRPLLLRSTGSRCAGSVVVAHGPSCSVACGIFPDQGSNACPLHWQADSQPLRQQGSPALSFSFHLRRWSLVFCFVFLFVFIPCFLSLQHLPSLNITYLVWKFKFNNRAFLVNHTWIYL